MTWLALGAWVSGLAIGLTALRKRFPTTINIISEYDDVDSVRSVILTARIVMSDAKNRPTLEIRERSLNS